MIGKENVWEIGEDVWKKSVRLIEPSTDVRHIKVGEWIERFECISVTSKDCIIT